MPTSQSGIYMVTAKDINNGKLQFDTARFTTEEAYRTLLTDKSRPKKGDLLLTKDGALGRVALVDDRVICINQSVAIIRLNNKAVPEFIKVLLESPVYQQRMLEDAGGTTIKHIYITIVDKMPIVLPPTLAEQEAIAEALSDADALIESLEALLAKKRQVKQGAMSELLSGKRRVVESGKWEVKKLGDVIQEIGDGATPSTSNPLNFGGSINWAVIEDIQDEITTTKNTLTERGLKSCAAKLWSAGTLIVSTGATIGEVGIAKVPLATKQGICGLVIDQSKANTHFIKYWFKLNKNNLLQKAQGSTIKEVRAPTLVQFEILLPPLPEQTAIAEILSDMDAEIRALEGKLSKARAVKAGMMSALLGGRVRLV